MRAIYSTRLTAGAAHHAVRPVSCQTNNSALPFNHTYTRSCRALTASAGATQHAVPSARPRNAKCAATRVPAVPQLKFPILPPATLASSYHRTRSSNSRRYFSEMPSRLSPEKYEAVVVGAGPAGVTCVGNLLDRKIEPILWVDPEFSGGRVNKLYREVPSNTKVTMFVQFAEGVTPFRKIISGTPSRSRWEEPSPSDGVAVDRKDKLSFLRDLDQNKGCDLGLAADMILVLTEGLKNTPGIESKMGKVSQAVLDEATNQWQISIDASGNNYEPVSNIQTKRLILCNGSTPIETALPIPDIPHLNLDYALSPTRLSKILLPRGPTTVSVIGASHSAILVLRNLYNLASTTKSDLKIKWFTRHALRYAEFMDGWILRDNTGLKGEVAVWAKDHLEPEVFTNSPVSKYVDAINYEKGDEERTFREHLPGSDLVVQAIGYTRNPIPILSTKSGKTITPTFDHESGGFTYTTPDTVKSKLAAKLPGVYGAGIAWPERVKDPHGNVEYAVGFFKFMKFVKRVSPAWN